MRWHLLSYNLRPAWLQSGNVVAGNDGDSLTVMKQGEAEEIRLYGIDCPKKNE
jgi:endonuclease YncB( thermonuclease family)